MCTFGIKNWDPIECQVKGDAWEKYGKERKTEGHGNPSPVLTFQIWNVVTNSNSNVDIGQLC